MEDNLDYMINPDVILSDDELKSPRISTHEQNKFVVPDTGRRNMTDSSSSSESSSFFADSPDSFITSKLDNNILMSPTERRLPIAGVNSLPLTVWTTSSRDISNWRKNVKIVQIHQTSPLESEVQIMESGSKKTKLVMNLNLTEIKTEIDTDEENNEFGSTEVLSSNATQKSAWNLEMKKSCLYELGRLRYLNERKTYNTEGIILSCFAIHFNSSDYTAWSYRKSFLATASLTYMDKIKELAYSQFWTSQTPKCYQCWYHRQWVFENLITQEEETIKNIIAADIEDLEQVFDKDTKNFNAFLYRQFLVNNFSLDYENEFEFTRKMINRDCRNNSIWAYRYQLCCLSGQKNVEDELRFCIDWIRNVPHNEASWNYLKSLFKDPFEFPFQSNNTSSKGITRISWSSVDEQVIQMLSDCCDPRPNELVTDNRFYLDMEFRRRTAIGDFEKANEILVTLRDKVDEVRHSYWNWMIRRLKIRDIKDV